MKPTALVSLLVLASGCVTQSTYDALKTERDGLNATLAEKSQAFAKLDDKKKSLDLLDRAFQAAGAIPPGEPGDPAVVEHIDGHDHDRGFRCFTASRSR